MAHYSIYIPDVVGSNAAAHLERVGMADLLDPSGANCFEVPIGGLDEADDAAAHGVLIAWQDGPTAIGGDNQKWRPVRIPRGESVAERPDFWIGWLTHWPPTPRDLYRVDALGGRRVRLRDGREWMIPIATLLPAFETLDVRGLPSREIDARYRQLWDDAARYHDHVLKWAMECRATGETVPMIALGDEFEAACRCLAANYRINATVARALSLVGWYQGSNLAIDILLATSEYDVTVSVAVANELVDQKKTAEVIPAHACATTNSVAPVSAAS